MSCSNPNMPREQQETSQHVDARRHSSATDQEDEALSSPLSYASQSLAGKATADSLLTSSSGTSTSSASPESSSSASAVDKPAKTSSSLAPRSTSPVRHPQELPPRPTTASRPTAGKTLGHTEHASPKPEVITSTSFATDPLPISPTSVFRLQGGLQAQFISSSSPFAEQAQITDLLGISYQVPVVYEAGLPLSLEELNKKATNTAWSKHHLHLVEEISGKQVLYIGKMGLAGGLDKDECPYRPSAASGEHGYTNASWPESQTHWVEFERNSEGYWEATARHKKYWLGSEWETTSGIKVYSNYSDLSTEELQECSMIISYDCGIVGNVRGVNYVLAHLSSSDRARFERQKEERQKAEAEQMARARRERQESDRRKAELCAKEEAAFERTKEQTLVKCAEVADKISQSTSLAAEIAHKHGNNLSLAHGLYSAQQTNLGLAKGLALDTRSIEDRIGETIGLIAKIQAQKEAFEKKKSEVEHRADSRRSRLQDLQKAAADLRVASTSGLRIILE
jgi:hypothetical protein